MEKQIKDYLHLYVGCDCTFYHTVMNRQLTEKLTHALLASAVNPLHNVLNLKLILRKLDSMTEEEIVDLVKIMLAKTDVHVVIERTEEKDFIIATYNTAYPESDYDKNQFDKIEMRLTISDIYGPCSLQNNWDYVKGNSTGVSNQQLFRHHEMTRFLLSKGFDLFGLLTEGLAIEKASK